jgi:hypothetical protein
MAASSAPTLNRFQPPLDTFKPDIENVQPLQQASKLADQIIKLADQITEPRFDLAHVLAHIVNRSAHMIQLIEDKSLGFRHGCNPRDED